MSWSGTKRRARVAAGNVSQSEGDAICEQVLELCRRLAEASAEPLTETYTVVYDHG